MAWWRGQPPKDLAFHSDRGSPLLQCGIPEGPEGLGHAVIGASQRKLLGYAPTESLWGSAQTRVRARSEVRYQSGCTRGGDGLDRLLKSGRLHSTLGYLSHMQFERRWLAAQQRAAA